MDRSELKDRLADVMEDIINEEEVNECLKELMSYQLGEYDKPEHFDPEPVVVVTMQMLHMGADSHPLEVTVDAADLIELLRKVRDRYEYKLRSITL